MSERGRVALVQDWLTGMRGGEKVLEALCEIFPNADIFTLVYLPEKISERIRRHVVRSSFIQRLPFAHKRHQLYFPLFPAAIEQFELSEYDLVVSTSHCVAKGVLTRPDTLHICYSHTPVRYAWDFRHLYQQSARPRWLARTVLPLALSYLRTWDEASANRADLYIANSRNVAMRIARYYGRHATVVHPPVDTRWYTPEAPVRDGDHYLLVSAMVPYKRDDLALEVLVERGLPFLVVGDGPERKNLERIGRNGRGRFVGRSTDEELLQYYRRCKALLYPGEEDFGITPVEANACGRPVIAYGKGGALETQVDGATGLFFEHQTCQSLSDVLERFEGISFDSPQIRSHAERFSKERFLQQLSGVLTRARDLFRSEGRIGFMKAERAGKLT